MKNNRSLPGVLNFDLFLFYIWTIYTITRVTSSVSTVAAYAIGHRLSIPPVVYGRTGTPRLFDVIAEFPSSVQRQSAVFTPLL